jgi:hypothetical protein
VRFEDTAAKGSMNAVAGSGNNRRSLRSTEENPGMLEPSNATPCSMNCPLRRATGTVT